MKLLTKEIEAKLRANGRTRADCPPLLKLFNPCGAYTALFTELAEDGDTLFGLADMGFGCPELGYSSLAEIMAIRLPFGLKIERDRSFEASHPLSVYADAARRACTIVETDFELEQAANQHHNGGPRHAQG